MLISLRFGQQLTLLCVIRSEVACNPASLPEASYLGREAVSLRTSDLKRVLLMDHVVPKPYG